MLVWVVSSTWKALPGSPLRFAPPRHHKRTSYGSACLSACAVGLLAGGSPDLDVGSQRGLKVTRLYPGRTLRGQLQRSPHD